MFRGIGKFFEISLSYKSRNTKINIIFFIKNQIMRRKYKNRKETYNNLTLMFGRAVNQSNKYNYD